MDHPVSPDRRLFLARASAVMGLALAAPAVQAEAEPVVTLSGRAFATGWRIVLPSGVAVAPLRAPVQALLAEVDRQMSPWRADSEVCAVNRASAGAMGVGPELARVTQAALSISAASGGAFDPTVGPEVARWGFGPIAQGAAPDWQEVSCDGARLDKARDGLTLDLCGIAKGRALDRISDLLLARGLGDHLVEIGGELRASGLHPAGRPWQVGVEDPRPGQASLVGQVTLRGAIATSGIKDNSYQLAGKRYSHIIDPATGRPVGAGALASVSVRAGTGMEADGWATALMAAGGVAGPQLARAQGLDSLFLRVQDGVVRAETTGAFALSL